MLEMRKKMSGRIKLFLMLFLVLVPLDAGAVYVGDIQQYTSSPPFLPDASDPNILFLPDFSINMVRPGYGVCYEEIADCRNYFWNLNDDYDSTIPYYGYFDNGYSDLDDKVRKDEIKKNGYDDSLAYTYTCDATECKKDPSGAWNGNWLNWLAMTQYDLMHKVLVGGNATTAPDTNNITTNNGTDIYSALAVLDGGAGRIYKVVGAESSYGRQPYTSFWTPQKIKYNWVSTPATANAIFSNENADDVLRTDTDGLPFAFTFFTTTYPQGTPVNITTNGVIGFDSSLEGGMWKNYDLADGINPHTIIAPLWDDLYVSSGYGSKISTFTIGETPNRVYVISYEDMKHFSDSAQKDRITFQVLLFERSSEIVFQYKAVASDEFYGYGKSATIGVENQASTRAKKYAYCTNDGVTDNCPSNSVENETAIHITPGSMIFEVVPQAAKDTVFQLGDTLAAGTEHEVHIPVVVTNKADATLPCDTTNGLYDIPPNLKATVNTPDKNGDKCGNHMTGGLYQDLAKKAEEGDLGYRLAIMYPGGRTSGTDDEDGVKTAKAFNEDPSTDLIGSLRSASVLNYAPLAESLYDSMQYYRQKTGIGDVPIESKSCWKTDVAKGSVDPYCEKRTGEMIYCCRSFILLISGGNYTNDFQRNIFDDVIDSGDKLITSYSGAFQQITSDPGSRAHHGYLDDVAYKVHLTDMRDFASPADPEDPPKVDVYVVNAYGEGVGAGTEALKSTARYGGFRDADGDGFYTNGEDDRDSDGLPDTYFEPSGGASLKDKITEAVENILKGAASGTSVSVLSTSAGGQGAVYQAYFYPSKIEGRNEDRSYPGYMRGFFMDNRQQLRDDASGLKYSDPVFDSTGEAVITHPGQTDETKHDARLRVADVSPDSTKLGDYVARMHVEDGQVKVFMEEHASTTVDAPLITDPNHEPDPLIDEVVSIWEAGEILARKDKDAREIYTWVDFDLDGVIDDDNNVLQEESNKTTDEIILFNDSNALRLAPFLRAGDPDGAFAIISGVPTGFLNLTTEAEDIVDFTRGEFVKGYRNRCITIRGLTGDETFDTPSLLAKDPSSGTTITESADRRDVCGKADGEQYYGRVWPLGDIIYSTPTLVSGPRERYDEIYGDPSYRLFKEQYVNRRNVIYVGSNDGMLHAVNAGFFDETETKFCRGDDGDTSGIEGLFYETTKECGDMPKNLGYPQLPDSDKKNYKLGDEMWGFIPYENLPHLAWLACNGTGSDPSTCGASDYRHVYFMDQRAKATDVRIFSDDDNHPGGWGTILIVGMRYGGGAMDLDIDGNGTDKAGEKIRSAYYVFDVTNPEIKPVLLYRFADLNMGFTTSYPAVVRTKDGANEAWFVVFGSGPKNDIGEKDQNRDYNSDTTTTQEGYVYVYELGGTGQSRKFSTSAFGDTSVIMGDPATVDVNLDFNVDVIYIGSAISGSSGKVYRINTGSSPTVLSTWPAMTVLFEDTDMGAIFVPPSASLDDLGNFWVYFGTGRLRSSADMDTTEMQRFYAVKDNCWQDTSSADCTASGANKNFVISDLYRTNEIVVGGTSVADNIQVTEGAEGACGGSGSCSYFDLISFARGKQGWYYDLQADGTKASERILARSAILGGLVMFTSYTPVSSSCDIYGTSDLYALYYETGTAYNQPVLKKYDASGNEDTSYNETEMQKKLFLGEGMPTAIGIAVGETVTGFVQKSTGEIVRVEAAPGIGSRSGRSSWREKVKGGGTVEVEETYKHIVK